jgi:cytochrome c-type biogenesis protein CcmE
MKRKYLLGGLAVIALGLFAAMNLRQSITPYVGFAEARRARADVQVNGKLVKGSSHYDIRSGILRFETSDAKGDVMPVEYHKSPPANFEHSTGMVIVGRFEKGVFQAKDLLVKCPSKYEKKEGK